MTYGFIGSIRDAGTLIELADEWNARARRLASQRPLLRCAFDKDERALTTALREEEQKERERDRQYWKALREELEKRGLPPIGIRYSSLSSGKA